MSVPPAQNAHTYATGDACRVPLWTLQIPSSVSSTVLLLRILLSWCELVAATVHLVLGCASCGSQTPPLVAAIVDLWPLGRCERRCHPCSHSHLFPRSHRQIRYRRVSIVLPAPCLFVVVKLCMECPSVQRRARRKRPYPLHPGLCTIQKGYTYMHEMNSSSVTKGTVPLS